MSCLKNCHLLRLLLQRFVKHDLLTDKSDKQLKDVKLEPRSVEMCDFGEKTKGLLRKLKKDTDPRVTLLQKDMLKFLQRSAQYLQQKLPLTNVVLNSLRCLKCTSRADPGSNELIVSLAKQLPRMFDDLIKKI